MNNRRKGSHLGAWRTRVLSVAAGRGATANGFRRKPAQISVAEGSGTPSG